MNRTDELRWIRVFTPDHIPTYLIEQIRDKDYTIEEFFEYHRINCTIKNEKGFQLNPFSHLYVLANPENQVKGILWFSVDPMSKDILIQTYSIDKEYWNKGYAVKKLTEHIKKIKDKGKLNKIYWTTNYPKHSERYGFKRSKAILMEYSGEKNGEDTIRKYGECGKSKSDDSRAIKLPVEHIKRTNCSTSAATTESRAI